MGSSFIVRNFLRKQFTNRVSIQIRLQCIYCADYHFQFQDLVEIDDHKSHVYLRKRAFYLMVLANELSQWIDEVSNVSYIFDRGNHLKPALVIKPTGMCIINNYCSETMQCVAYPTMFDGMFRISGHCVYVIV